MTSVRIGGSEAPCRAVGALDGELRCELLPDCESAELIIRAVPGAKAVVTIAGMEFEGRVKVTSPDDYVTVVEF